MGFKIVQIGNTNFCNNNCVFCPHDKMKREKGIMNLKLFKKIVKDLKQYEKNLKGIILNEFGEPLIDPKFNNKMEYLKSQMKTPITFNTNAILLDKKIAKSFIENQIDEVRISIYTTEREEYKKLFGTDNFEKIKTNLKNLMKMKKQAHSQKPKVIMGFINPPEGKITFKEWKRYWQGYADEFVKASTLNYGRGLDYNKVRNCKKLSCLRPQNRFVILWNGDVCICCFDYEGEVIFGNLKNQNIKEIIGTKKYQHYLGMHKKNKINKLPLCKDCDEPVPATFLNILRRLYFLNIKESNLKD